MESFANIGKSDCCGGNLVPLQVNRVRGSNGYKLHFECDECNQTYTADTAKRVRLLKDPLQEDSDADGDDSGGGGGRRKQKARKQTNGRPEDVVRTIVGTLLAGNNYREFCILAVARKMQPIHEQTFNDYLAFIHPKVKALTDEAIDLMRYLLAVRCGDLLNGIVLTSDWFWGTRGHTSDNGSGTICEWKTGGIVAYKHFCKRSDKMSDIEAFEYTSKAMDAMGFKVMMDDFINWMESSDGLEKLIEDYDLDLEPKLDGFVLDGDSSTDVVVDAKKAAMRPDARLAEAVNERACADGAKFCADMRNRVCTNHLAKNAGKAALALGQKWHTACDCPPKLTREGVPYATGAKEHVGLNSESDPLIKQWQLALGAALRAAVEWKKKPANVDRPLKDLAIEGVEEVFNHLCNVHDAPGFHTGTQRKCRLHSHDPPHKTRHFNDCGKFKSEMKKWLMNHVINNIDDIIHPELGALSQNASERVGDVSLLYRSKETPLLATHYTISTTLAIAHVNSLVFDKIRLTREQAGEEPDAKLEAFGTF